jgi:DNA-binding FrmR family transcriptional regulator
MSTVADKDALIKRLHRIEGQVRGSNGCSTKGATASTS